MNKTKITCRWCGDIYLDPCTPDSRDCCGKKKCVDKNLADFHKVLLKTVKNDHIEKLEKSHLEYIKSGWMVTGQEFRPNTNTIIAKINEIIEKINTL